MKSLNYVVIIAVLAVFISCKSELRDKAKSMKGKSSFNKFIVKCRASAREKHFNPGFCTDMYNSLLQESFNIKGDYNFKELFHKYQLKFKLRNYKARKQKENYKILKKKREAARKQDQELRSEKINEMQKKINQARDEAITEEQAAGK